MPTRIMSGRQADKLALSGAGLIGFLFRGLFLHDWKPSVDTGAALVGLLSVLFEVGFAGGEGADAPPSLGRNARPAHDDKQG